MHDVVVVGGGFAGATAARELSSAGFDTVLLEARDRLGGRAWHQPDALAGLGLEMGCQFFNTGYRHIMAEIERYNVPRHVFGGGLDGTHWILPDGRVHEGGPPLGPAQVAELEDVVVGLREVADKIDLSMPWADQFPGAAGEELDVSVDEWLVRRGASPELRHVMSLALAAWLVTPDAERSLLYLARMVAADGGLYRYLAGDNLILDHGTTDLVERIAGDADVDIRLCSPVHAVSQDSTRVMVDTPAGGVAARAVVWAAPLSLLPHTTFEPPLDGRRLAAARSRSSGEGSKIWALVTGVPPSFFAFGPVEGLHSAASVDELTDGTSLVVGFGSGAHWVDGNDPRAVEHELRRWFPEARVIDSIGHQWLADPWTRNASPFPRPGDAMACDSVLSKPDGRVFFAGSDTSLTRPGFVDGAIETGFRACSQVSQVLSEEVGRRGH